MTAGARQLPRTVIASTRIQHALGEAGFGAYPFTGQWASVGYWVAVIPAAGIDLERRWSNR